MCQTKINNNIECGRVFIRNRNHVELCIQCLLCSTEFDKWSLFEEHIYECHESSAKRIDLRQKQKECAVLHEDQVEVVAFDGGAKSPEPTQLVNKSHQYVVVMSEETDNEVMEEEIDTDAMTPDIISGIENVHKLIINQQDDLDEEEQITKLVVEILPTFPRGDDREGSNARCVTSDEQEIKEYCSQMKNETKNSSARCFFKLRTTEPHIILGFIDIMRHYPCNWDPLNSDYACKDRREKSLKKICKALKEHFQISITSQLARSSILTLVRWFEGEYLRSEQFSKTKTKRSRWSLNGYVCAHPVYYNKLYEFLPHKHLQLVSCAVCKRVFKTENQLRSHNHQFHGGDLPFKCRHCSRSFLYASTWKYHMNRHTKKHVWSCSLCQYTGYTKTDYNLHMVTHSDLRAFVCDLCGASYKSSTSLNVHLRTHEPPKLQCSKCSKKFYENYRLKRHLQIHEAEEAVRHCDIIA